MSLSSPENGRGAGWVVAQFTLMLAVLAAGPLVQGQWSGWWHWTLGGALMLLGAWVGIRGDRDLGRHRTPYPRPKQDGQLVTAGIFAFVRHPLYLAVMALGFAWALLWRSTPALALAFLQVVFLDAKARREEQWLRQRYPAYDQYARQVKRFIPAIY